MDINNINIDDPVVYMPKHLGRTILYKNLGRVTSKNDTFVFVRYLGDEHSQATNPLDLYSLKNRPDLIEKL